MSWPAFALARIAEEGAAALITLAATEGSTPREAGARMVVSATQTHGTVGGGNLEFLLIDQARRLLASDLAYLQQDYPLGPLLAQCCGGHVRVLIERLDSSSVEWLEPAARSEASAQPYTLTANITGPTLTRTFAFNWPADAIEGATLNASRRQPWTRLTEHIRPTATHLYIFGAGHVGTALAQIAQSLPFRLRWIDTRSELAGTPSLEIHPDPATIVSEAAANSFFVILTHAHEHDYQLARAILRRADAAYCGLIGSGTKRARFLSRLAKDGVDASGLICPIGGGLIASKLPAAIAVATSAELLVRLESSASVESANQKSTASNANVASQCSPM
jgi:xanthine dehydrogenase accessory factor